VCVNEIDYHLHEQAIPPTRTIRSLIMISKLIPAALAICCASIHADVVNIYSARQENLIKPILDIYTERTGTTINLLTGNADELIQRLSLEGDNSPADLIITVDVGRLYRAKEAGVLQSTSSPLLEEIVPAHYRDPEDRKSTRLNSSHVKISYAVLC